MSARLQEVDAVLTEHIRPQTFPVAVKIFQGPEGLPEKMKLPTKTFNHPLAMCQGITLARKYGWTVGFFKEDMACAVGQVILGYVEEPEFIKDGSLVYPLYTDTLEAG
ncbi:MAG TPA: DUF169 domain-containing protein, partial [Bacillota bacterium]|nr:DUF169 domain-containing protein [Bacillota bacterium]